MSSMRGISSQERDPDDLEAGVVPIEVLFFCTEEE
jgi:hypothetical protein